MKAIMRVYDALVIGCDTSDQIAALTGLSVAAASAHLCELRDLGLVRVVSPEARRFNTYGRNSHVWAAVKVP